MDNKIRWLRIAYWTAAIADFGIAKSIETENILNG